MSQKIRWSPEEIATMRALTNKGLGYKRIAAAINRSAHAVQMWLRRHRLDQERIRKRAAVAELLDTAGHLSNREIARRAGCSSDLVGSMRDQRPTPKREPYCTHPLWLAEPCGRIKALRAAHGIEPS